MIGDLRYCRAESMASAKLLASTPARNSGISTFSIAEIVSFLSRHLALRPGDLIGSGTVGGGCLLEIRESTIGRYLQPGDEVLRGRGAVADGARGVGGLHGGEGEEEAALRADAEAERREEALRDAADRPAALPDASSG